MHEQLQRNDDITLTQAAKLAPGRPSTNCIWRWCRRGVLARTGERVRLQHLRVGGKIYTRAAWVEEFGRTLAEADAAYFDARDQAAKSLPPRDPRYNAPKRGRRVVAGGRAPRDRDDGAEINRELEEQGL